MDVIIIANNHYICVCVYICSSFSICGYGTFTCKYMIDEPFKFDRDIICGDLIFG